MKPYFVLPIIFVEFNISEQYNPFQQEFIEQQYRGM